MIDSSSVVCFTSISLSYLAKARVLAHTLKRHHPHWELWVCISDREPDGFRFDIDAEPFDRVIWSDELPLEGITSWMFKHDLVELCTAVKGPVIDEIVQTGAGKIVYLDPDIAVFGSLQPLVDLLDTNSILLTPHQLDPETDVAAILDNEVSSLRHGTYNLGFLAIRNDETGRRMVRWWRERLERLCYDDPANGTFVDQKWCDLVPAFFEDVKIVRDPGCNVASWNISRRRVTIDPSGAILANGQPLRFFHFTKLGALADVMTQRYARDNVEVYEIWSWYKRMVDRYQANAIPSGWWYYSRFANGVPIPKTVRILYRSREDLQQAFADPFAAGKNTFFEWLSVGGYV